MRDLRISSKLAVSFAVVVVLALIIGIVGIYSSTSMSNAADDMYKNKALPLGDLADAMDMYQRLRVQVRNAIIYSGDEEQLKIVTNDMTDRISKFEAAMQAYKPTLASEKGTQLYNAVADNYYNIFKPGILAVLEGAKKGESQEYLLEIMAPTTVAANQIAVDLKELIAARMGVMETASAANKSLGNQMNLIIIAVIVIAVIVSVAFAAYISGMISKPVKVLTDFMKLAGTKGEISVSKEEQADFDKYGRSKDEIGQCISFTNNFIKHITVISNELEAIAGGDISIDVELLSETDGMGISLKKMVENLNDMFGEIQVSTVQVSSASKQVSDGSQSLAQGSTEQAAIVEQLSSSISEISSKTKENADMASKAANLAETIKRNAEKGSSQMDHMMEAVKEINQASQSINKVIKVIDDIAFQTNILALNAAVEAARAGQHGKGFAVVAEEVRNLAAKSADAAKDTGGLIANSMEKAELGAKIADETAASLVEIVAGINESSLIVAEIAKSSEQQADGITQINKGIDQVASTIQQTSATAEESAAASEEMSGQAVTLENLMGRFKLKNNSGMRIPTLSASSHKPAQLAMPPKSYAASQEELNSEFGKY